MRRRYLIGVIVWESTLFVAPAWAITNVFVPDASRLSYSTEPSGKVWLRNLSTFSTSALPGVCNYSINPTTPEGENVAIMILTAATQGQSINVGIPDNRAPGQ
jgi:hypothetical protein